MFGPFLIAVFVVLTFEFLVFLLYSILQVLGEMCFRNNFFPVCDLTFHSLNKVLTEQRFLITMKFNISILLFMKHAFDIVSEKSLPKTKSSSFSHYCLAVFCFVLFCPLKSHLLNYLTIYIYFPLVL